MLQTGRASTPSSSLCPLTASVGTDFVAVRAQSSMQVHAYMEKYLVRSDLN